METGNTAVRNSILWPVQGMEAEEEELAAAEKTVNCELFIPALPIMPFFEMSVGLL